MTTTTKSASCGGAFGRFLGNAVPLVLMIFAAAQVNGFLRIALISWVAFVVIVVMLVASAKAVTAGE